jgi:hypothetical protein
MWGEPKQAMFVVEIYMDFRTTWIGKVDISMLAPP